MKQIIAPLCCAALALAAVSCGQKSDNAAEQPQLAFDQDCLYQVSTLQALMEGDYYGQMTVEDFLKRGDIGIGTLEGVNGEVIVLDGVCYQALVDGTVAKVANDETVPYGVVTTFNVDYTVELNDTLSMPELTAALDSVVAKNATPNAFVVCKIKGTFPKMNFRSIAKQQEPYVPFIEVVAKDSKKYEYENLEGTLIAFYCPPYVGGVNMPGWHLHFLSNDASKGGHVLDLTMAKGTAQIDRTDAFCMYLPNDDVFKNANLLDKEEVIEITESAK